MSPMSQDDCTLRRILQAQQTILGNLNRPNVIRKLRTYCCLQASLLQVDVSADPYYRRRYTWFYGMRLQPHTWLDKYFCLLQAQKGNNAISFAPTLRTLPTQRVEGSFSSKLVATIRPDMPVIDQYVISNLGLKRPPGSFEQRIDGWVKLHSHIHSLYKSLLRDDMFKEVRDHFDGWFQQFPCLTEVKKLDILLWQLR